MYLRRLFSDMKTKLVYSNGPIQVHFSCPVSDGSNRTAYKACLTSNLKQNKTKKKTRLTKEGTVANIAERQ